MAENRLPHWTSSKVSKGLFEPITANLYDIILQPPTLLTGNELNIMHEHIKTVSGLITNPSVDPITQKYKNVDRSFFGFAGQTFMDIAITLTTNLNDSNQAYTYKIIRDWYRLGYDPATGATGLKKEYSGYMEAFQYNRKGDIFRKIKCYNIFPGAPEGFADLDFESTDPQELTVTFRCDYYEEELT